MLAAPLLFLKAHVKGYVKKDGTVVKPYDDKRPTGGGQAPTPAPAPSPAPTPAPTVSPGYKPPKWTALGSMKAKDAAAKAGGSPPKVLSVKQLGLFGGFMAPDHAKDLGQKPLFGGKPEHRPLPKSSVAHPQAGEKGQTVMVHYPEKPSAPSTWTDPAAVATFVPGGAAPAQLHGVPLAPWTDAPTTEEAWDYVEGQNDDIEEPGMELPKGKVPASGVVVMEPDGRVWVVAPTNAFGGTKNTFPKGGREYGLSLQANAIKEAFEESGLKVEIDSFLGDIQRTTSVARYYLARRVGGTPVAMGWESQAVRLVPAAQLRKFLDRSDDKKIAEWLEDLAP